MYKFFNKIFDVSPLYYKKIERTLKAFLFIIFVYLYFSIASLYYMFNLEFPFYVNLAILLNYVVLTKIVIIMYKSVSFGISRYMTNNYLFNLLLNHVSFFIVSYIYLMLLIKLGRYFV